MKIKKPNKNINVLIPDGEKLLSLHVLNCLAGIDHVNIHVLSKVKWVETKFSRKIKSFTPHTFNYTENEWIEILKSEIVKNDINVLLPVHVENIRLCSKYRNVFNSLLPNLIVPNTEYFDIANNKWKLNKLLEENNLNKPFTVHSEAIYKTIDEKLNYPVLVKPLEEMGGNGIKKIINKESLHRYLIDKKNLIIQEFINGYDIDMSVLCENGKILAYTIQKGYLKWNKPYQPYLGIEFVYEDKIFTIVEKLMRKLDWTGVAHLDLRFDEDDKKYKVIEINPRFWGSVVASKQVGINFPYLYCLSSIGVKYDMPTYQFEKHVNNKGLIKILKSKFSNKSPNYENPKYNSLSHDLIDPFPKTYKYTIKIFKKLLPKKIRFLKKFKYDIY